MTTICDICTLEDIPDNSSRGFSIKDGTGSLDFFIVRKDNGVYGYVNRCPHTGVSLEWIPDSFLDTSSKVIQCSTHGAQFRIGDGFCIYGPCAGKSLDKVQLKVVDDKIKLILQISGAEDE